MFLKSKKTFIYIFLLVSVFFTLGSCNDEIFFRISIEIPLIEPLIEGSPSNFVIFNNVMYVAAGRKLWRYSTSIVDTEVISEWKSNELDRDLDENIFISQLAVTDTYIYVLFYQDTESEIIKTLGRISSITWNTLEFETLKFETFEKKEITEYTDTYKDLQTIYAVNNLLYLGLQKSTANEQAVYFIDASDTVQPAGITSPANNPIDGPSALLRGAVARGSDIFLCTGASIYRTTGGTATRISGTENHNFVGIVMLPDNTTIIAITRDGVVYNVATAAVTKTEFEFDDERLASGAIATWEKKDEPDSKVLLVGRQDKEYSTSSGYTYGYMELELDITGSLIPGAKFKEPGKSPPTTIPDNDTYASSLGIIPISHLFQVPQSVDDNMTLFASTYNNGVWSVRIRSGDTIWNAEE
ncbi:MAG: hypothetical protein FWD26_06150 [Treponema sp.]|nr:hypothetical protein [Treponema sp.]